MITNGKWKKKSFLILLPADYKSAELSKECASQSYALRMATLTNLEAETKPHLFLKTKKLMVVIV